MSGPDERDLALINAMQINPRASWAAIGLALDVDAGTAARRWAQLVADGSAWLTVDPGVPRTNRMFVAFLEVDCAPEQAVAAGPVLAHHPGVALVEHVTGDHDLCVMVYTPELSALSEFLLESIARVPGVLGVRSHIGTQLFLEGSTWQLGALAPDRQRMLRVADRTLARTTTLLPDADVRPLMHALSDDCRISISELALRLGLSRHIARRRLDAALGTRQLVIRCDVSRAMVGMPIATNLRTTVPPNELAATARSIAAVPTTRFLAGLTGGPSNLLLSFWLRTVDDIHEIEALLAERFPRLQIDERAIALRTIKLCGRILDQSGRATAAIVMDPWQIGEHAYGTTARA